MNPCPPAANSPALLYHFLISPRLRVARHAVLIMVLIVISLNQTFLSYRDSLPALGGWVYLIVLFIGLTYIAVVYFNLYYLLPRYLPGKRFLTYISFLSVGMLVALTLQVALEYSIRSRIGILPAHEVFTSIGWVMDYLSSFLMDMFCMIGGTMTMLLKLWMVDNQRVVQLEQVHAQSEVVKLKEQVSPGLLFRILHRSGQLALTDGDKASGMLMKLSQLLRYQLYDCSREKVLLSAEINFLTRYLSLEQLYNPQLNYTLSSGGEVNRRLVPPLLFLPFVQYAVKQLECVAEAHLSVCVDASGETDVIFTCSCPGANLNPEYAHGEVLSRIRQRLDLLYGTRYGLLLSAESICLELKGGEA